MKNKASVFLVFLFFTISCSHNLPDFTSRLSTRLPTESKTESIGEYSLGCLQGAQTFTGKEKGLILSQVKRGRYWGHPDLINLLTRAGEEFNKHNTSKCDMCPYDMARNNYINGQISLTNFHLYLINNHLNFLFFSM